MVGRAATAYVLLLPELQASGRALTSTRYSRWPCTCWQSSCQTAPSDCVAQGKVKQIVGSTLKDLDPSG